METSGPRDTGKGSAISVRAWRLHRMAWLAVGAGLWVTPAWAQGGGPVIGVVLVIKGEAWADGQTLRPGDPLQAGVTLRTGQTGRLRLRFEDGSVLVLGDRSELRLERYEQPAGGARQASLWLQLGLIGQTVRPQSGGSWQVRTPSAVTAVRGTE
ncbi:MAG TPA: FecR domain-containing protein, partial [Burkholderiaceae bacterium]|nr:FecR domain-containing protein [Burkholderiaceae bacterium]